MKIADLFGQDVEVVCLGLPLFYATLESIDVPAVWVESKQEQGRQAEQEQDRQAEEE